MTEMCKRVLTVPFLVPFLAFVVLATACGGARDSVTEAVAPGNGAAAGSACPVGTADCDDTGHGGEGGAADEPADDSAVVGARGLLGLYEPSLPADVRVARRGVETFMLTMDYVVGRTTVELDDTDGSGLRVVSATVELTDGPRTFELDR